MKKILAAVFVATFVLVIFTVSSPSDGTDYQTRDMTALHTVSGLLTDPNIAQPDAEEPTVPPQKTNPIQHKPRQADLNPSGQPLPNYLIDVSVADQKVYIYKDDLLVKEWIISTGKNASTPLGSFTIQNRGQWFYNEKYQQGAKWWVSFKDWGVYLFHSIPMDRDKNILTEEASLGSPASHGCIRLDIENAKWIYDNIPRGTPVNIHV